MQNGGYESLAGKTVEQPAVITDSRDGDSQDTLADMLREIKVALSEDEALPDDYKNIPATEAQEPDEDYAAAYERWIEDHEPLGDDDQDSFDDDVMLVDEAASERDVSLVTRTEQDDINDITTRYNEGLLTEREAVQQKALTYALHGNVKMYNEQAALYDALNPDDAPEVVDDAPEDTLVVASEEIPVVNVNDRDKIMQEINSFYELLDIPQMGRNFEMMDTIALQDHLDLLRLNNGGSLNMAVLLQQTEMEYDEFLKSETLKMRMRLIEQKSIDTVTLMQRMRNIMGNDFAINGVRAQEYHNMLKSAVSFISTVHEKIAAIGQQLGLKVPLNQFNERIDSVPIVENMPADPRVAIYVLNALMAHMDKFHMLLDNNRAQNQRAEERIKSAESREKHITKMLEDAQQRAKDLSEAFDKFTGNSSYWIIRDTEGRILRQIDPNEPIRHTRDLDLRGDYDSALVFPSRSGAKAWSHRLMGTRRFKNYDLRVFRVSIVEDN